MQIWSVYIAWNAFVLSNALNSINRMNKLEASYNIFNLYIWAEFIDWEVR